MPCLDPLNSPLSERGECSMRQQAGHCCRAAPLVSKDFSKQMSLGRREEYGTSIEPREPNAAVEPAEAFPSDGLEL